MSDIGTITEIEPEDGLGWIELDGSGDRVRFGGTACKGFVPSVGMKVEVLGTRPGYGGTVKATELTQVKGAAAAASSAGATEEGPAPRVGLHTVQSAGARADELLLKLLASADVNDSLHADLEAASFRVQPQPGLELGCKNPWLYAVASSGEGRALGIYDHPMFGEHPAQPWVLWDGSAGTLRFVAEDTGGLLVRVLATAAAAGVDAETVGRLRADLVKLGMPDEEGEPIGEGVKVPWLPPDEGELRSLDEYLAETDGAEMERGLLAHAFRHGDAQADAQLRSIYEAWEWSLPSWVS
jgi:hypothetical protein